MQTALNLPISLIQKEGSIDCQLTGRQDSGGVSASFFSLLLGCLNAEVKQAVACGEKGAIEFSEQEEEAESTAGKLINELITQLAVRQDTEEDYASLYSLLLSCLEQHAKQIVACEKTSVIESCGKGEESGETQGEEANIPLGQFVKRLAGEASGFLPQEEAEVLRGLKFSILGTSPGEEIGKQETVAEPTTALLREDKPFFTEVRQGSLKMPDASEVSRLLQQDPQIIGKTATTFSGESEAADNNAAKKYLPFFEQVSGEKLKVHDDSKVRAEIIKESSASPERPLFALKLEQDNCSAEEKLFKLSSENLAESEEGFSTEGFNRHALNIFEAESSGKDNATSIRRLLLEEKFTEVLKQNIVQEIAKKDLEKDFSLIKLKLYPEALGKLELSVSLEKGLLQARFLADSHHVAQLLESRLPELKDCLQENGSHWQEVNLTVDCRGDKEGFSQDSSAAHRFFEKPDVLSYSGESASSENYLQEDEKSLWAKTTLVDCFI